MATDFRSGTDFPRRGRDASGEFLWLHRVADKARAAAAGTIHDYIYPCPMDRGIFERWGVSPAEFDAALRECPTDEALLGWMTAHVDAAHRDAANRWVRDEKAASLDRQDREEGVPA